MIALTTGARSQTMADLLRRSAVRHPGRTAIVDGDVRVTYAELDEAVNRAANALAERGLAKGDRLALLGHNSLGFVITYFASARLGLICVPINYMLGAQEIAYILDHAGATAMVAEDMLLPLAEAGIAAAGREQLITVRGVIGDVLEPGWEPVHSWAAHTDATEPVADLTDDDPVELLYTSGTESRPKGTILTSRSLIAQHVSCFVDGEMTPGDGPPPEGGRHRSEPGPPRGYGSVAAGARHRARRPRAGTHRSGGPASRHASASRGAGRNRRAGPGQGSAAGSRLQRADAG